MRVIGAGLPRTATTTQMIAFETLGFGPCYHMRDLLGDLEHGLPLWEAAAEGNPDWAAVFGDAQSTCDWPSARYYKELIKVYPDAKVVLTVREPGGWVKSMRETVWAIHWGDSVMRHVSAARATIDPLWRRYIDLMGYINWDERNGAFAPVENTFSDEGFAEVIERWNDEVERTVPAERLLAWNPAEGWGPLCEFLDVDVPDQPVPRTNDTNAFKEGVLGGSLEIVNEWWDARERPTESLHGASLN
jgi:hypothetical protein